MSVTDPLIKDIKGHLLHLFTESTTQKITDSSENLENFCNVLEKIFYTGLLQKENLFHSNKRYEPYNWMCSLPTEGADVANFKYQNSIEEVQSCRIVKTSLGKFRLLIRHCLTKNCLHFPLQSVINTNRSRNFYETNSIIGDEILAEILLSVLLQCSKISFDLQLHNFYFLDLTWQIPDLIKLELVPSHSLGISISFSENKAIIIQIAPNSLVAECSEISIGDVLANLNGVPINSSCKGRLKPILRLNKGRPITLIIIKAFHKKNNDVFSPLKTILKNLQIDLRKITDSQTNIVQRNDNTASGVAVIQQTKTGFKGTYIGSVNVGNKGSVKQIEEGIRQCLSRPLKENNKTAILFEIGEMSIKIIDSESNQIIFKHSYMQISSCGSATNLPNYIAYISGEENCDTASNFTCHIFHVKDLDDACLILQSIGQGFCRTHFAV